MWGIIDSRLIPDQVFHPDHHRIPNDERWHDNHEDWYLLEKIENLESIIESLSKQQPPWHLYIRVPVRLTLSSHQKDMCRAAQISVIVLERSVLDTRPTKRYFWDAVSEKYYKDWYYEGYGCVDDAETVWWRQINQVAYSEVFPSEA